ncbi:hypothetical protein BV25DRAFT_1443030 [Artomyces pyxidatus]|uniref:Uncharacterized protein n=1 Tax=Artomyces pyxidatus TaxID=48021 RepID=A0ACB8SLA4_9AGAM|nr:hypothetical protein BV25DRAFT_1443030 [Artomyces pyxidatus]
MLDLRDPESLQPTRRPSLRLRPLPLSRLLAAHVYYCTVACALTVTLRRCGRRGRVQTKTRFMPPTLLNSALQEAFLISGECIRGPRATSLLPSFRVFDDTPTLCDVVLCRHRPPSTRSVLLSRSAPTVSLPYHFCPSDRPLTSLLSTV